MLRCNCVFGGHAAGIEVTNGGGGVIEGNEVCDNHFAGIRLATGVAPTLSGKRRGGTSGVIVFWGVHTIRGNECNCNY